MTYIFLQVLIVVSSPGYPRNQHMRYPAVLPHRYLPGNDGPPYHRLHQQPRDRPKGPPGSRPQLLKLCPSSVKLQYEADGLFNIRQLLVTGQAP